MEHKMNEIEFADRMLAFEPELMESADYLADVIQFLTQSEKEETRELAANVTLTRKRIEDVCDTIKRVEIHDSEYQEMP